MIVTTCNDVPGHSIVESIGIIRGIVVRSPGIGQAIMGGLKQIVGGNLEANCKVGVWSIFRPTRRDQPHNHHPKTWT